MTAVGLLLGLVGSCLVAGALVVIGGDAVAGAVLSGIVGWLVLLVVAILTAAVVVGYHFGQWMAEHIFGRPS